ncbi:MAG: dipeptidase [Firmicutes bacterium]|nr:dipeptidase [Bacillota bacterium]
MQDFLKIPSISALSEHASDVRDAADWLVNRLKQAGFDDAHTEETGGHPVVLAHYGDDPHKPTVLIYGHYDVQPVDPLSQWTHPPFTPTVENDIIYARGSSDDKGQVLMQIIAAEAWHNIAGKLPVNLKFLLEGEEEIGSVHLDRYILSHQYLLKSDVAVISDTPMFADDVPAICYGLRGVATLEIHLQGPFQDLHSGVFGGAVENPAHVLARLIASLHDDSGRVAVDGFYDAVDALTDAERQAFASLPFSAEEFRQSTGAPALWGDPYYTVLERIWARPTIDINGMWSGFTGEGRKTIIPQTAHAKISCRLVPHQDPSTILDQIKDHLLRHCPDTVTLTFTAEEGDGGIVTSLQHPAVKSAEEAIEQIYRKPAAYIRMGGSIPVVKTFAEVLDVSTVLLGFALPDENFHAPNEHFHLKNFIKGAQTLAVLWEEIGRHMPDEMAAHPV